MPGPYWCSGPIAGGPCRKDAADPWAPAPENEPKKRHLAHGIVAWTQRARYSSIGKCEKSNQHQWFYLEAECIWGQYMCDQLRATNRINGNLGDMGIRWAKSAYRLTQLRIKWAKSEYGPTQLGLKWAKSEYGPTQQGPWQVMVSSDTNHTIIKKNPAKSQ